MKRLNAVPGNIFEEYYQINEAILDSFPKYRPPLDLFVFKEDIAILQTLARKGERLTNEQVDRIHELCSEGDLFVSRADHAVYSKHIIKQLDLILVDPNLKEGEICDICIMALEHRLSAFFEQPVKGAFDPLHDDLLVVTEYLWNDPHRLKLFMRRLHRGDHNLAMHSINVMIIGLWLFALPKNDDMQRKRFDQAALALLLHDMGMIKVPVFITSKTAPLKREEREKILPHTVLGYKIADKLDLTFPFMNQAILEHHERLDGSGYPQKSKQISRFGLLTAVADAFSSMLQKRPYADAKTPLQAARELSDEKSRFDINLSSKLLAAYAASVFGKPV